MAGIRVEGRADARLAGGRVASERGRQRRGEKYYVRNRGYDIAIPPGS